MTLKEKLNELGKDVIVSIGSKNGGCYLYVDKNNQKAISKAFDTYRDNSVKRLAKAKENLKLAVLTSVELSGNNKQDEKLIYNHAANICRFVGTINSNTKYISDYVPVLDREVVECYLTIEEWEGLNIIVTGSEMGKKWFYKEK